MLDFIDPLLENNWWWVIVFLIGGFYFLVKGADWLVDGASAIAKQLGVSDLIIGLTVVAFGTSMPEFVVNMISASEGSTDLAITNILGSNAINIFVILGCTAMIWPVVSEKQSRKVDIPLACAGALLIQLCACVDVIWEWPIEVILAPGTTYISRMGGVLLLVCFVFYMYYLFKKAKKENKKHKQEAAQVLATEPVMAWPVAVGLIIVGLAGLTVGGESCVKSAVQIAHNMGVSEAVIGLTIVALGTSLPELATSCIAAFKHNSDLALGNCVGSCTFNIFFVLSISAIVHPLPSYDGLLIDAAMAFLGPALVWLYVTNDRKHIVSRWEGISLVAVYAAYLTYRLLML